jgi:hypothetical protein
MKKICPLIVLLLCCVLVSLPLQQSRAKENLFINPYCAVLVIVVGGTITICLWHLAKQTLYPPAALRGTTNLVVSGSCKGAGWPNVDGVYNWQKAPNFNQGLIYVNPVSGRCIWSGIAIPATDGDPLTSAYIWFLTDSPGGGPYNYCCSKPGNWCGWTNVLCVDPTGLGGNVWNYPWLPSPIDIKNSRPGNLVIFATNYTYPNGAITCGPDVEWQQPLQADFVSETSATDSADTNVYVSLFIGPDANPPGNSTAVFNLVQSATNQLKSKFTLSANPVADNQYGISPASLAGYVQDGYGISQGWTDPAICALYCTGTNIALYQAVVNGDQVTTLSTNQGIQINDQLIIVPPIPGAPTNRIRTLNRYTSLNGPKTTLLKLSLPTNISKLTVIEDGVPDEGSYYTFEK